MIHIGQYNLILSPPKKYSVVYIHIAQYNLIWRFVNIVLRRIS